MQRPSRQKYGLSSIGVYAGDNHLLPAAKHFDFVGACYQPLVGIERASGSVSEICWSGMASISTLRRSRRRICCFSVSILSSPIQSSRHPAVRLGLQRL